MTASAPAITATPGGAMPLPAAGARPFAPIEWIMAFRYLRPRRKEAFISVSALFSFLGVMLGVAALIIVMSVMNGFRKELLDKILGLNGHVIAQKIQAPFEDYEEVARRLAAVPGVKHALPLTEHQVVVASEAQTVGGLVRGMTETGVRSLPVVGQTVRFGTLDGFDKSGGIAIGTRLANILRVTVGDGVTLVAPRGAQTVMGTIPASKRYPVVAIFEMGMSEYDRTMIFMPLGEAQRFFRKPREADFIEILVDNPQVIDPVLQGLRAAAGPTLHFTDWRERNKSFFSVLEVERALMFIIVSLVVVVAALNIISGLMMQVRSKSRDIAVLRTMGATRQSVMRVFLISGASIGVIGTIAGLIIGIVFCWNIEAIRQFVQWLLNVHLMPADVYYLTRLPALIDPRETLATVAFALTASILSSLYPAWRASTLDPVEALRYE